MQSFEPDSHTSSSLTGGILGRNCKNLSLAQAVDQGALSQLQLPPVQGGNGRLLETLVTDCPCPWFFFKKNFFTSSSRARFRSSGLRTARPTSPTTALTAMWRMALAARLPSTGKATSPATRAPSPTSSCSRESARSLLTKEKKKREKKGGKG